MQGIKKRKHRKKKSHHFVVERPKQITFKNKGLGTIFVVDAIKNIKEDDESVSITVFTPIENVMRGTLCDVTFIARGVSVEDEDDCGDYGWLVQDLLCIRVFRYTDEQSSLGTILTEYKFLKH